MTSSNVPSPKSGSTSPGRYAATRTFPGISMAPTWGR